MTQLTKNYKIKILILNYNGVNFLKECLESVYKIDYPNFSVTVIDNLSTDNSINFIKSNYPDVELVLTDKNRLFAGGYNYYFNRSQDNCYYLILNNDTIVSKTILNQFIIGLNKYGKRAIYGPTITFSNEKKLIWYSGAEVDLKKGIIRHLNIRKNLEDLNLRDCRTGYITGCCMFVHSSIVSDLNGFDESFKMYMEDVDFCLRARFMGIKSIYLASPRLFHHVSGTVNLKVLKVAISFFKLAYKHIGYLCFLIFPLFVIRKITGK